MEISYAMDNMNRLSGASTWKTVNGNVKSIKCYSTVANTKESEINSRIMTNQIDRVSTNVTYSKAHLLEFYKFLTRNSGRRRMRIQFKKLCQGFACCVVVFLIVSSIFPITDACSSRTTPKPRPPSPTPRPNITFHTYKCPPAYAAWYCLNEATCFTVKIGDSLLYNCECADGYMGPRCEYKDLDGSYLPTRPRVMLETASIASGAIGSLVLIIIGWCCWCIRRHQQRKLDGKEHNVDTVDSPGIVHVIHSERLLRPFGTHHLKTIPMSDSFK
ncbi:uncharacterized protein LOC128309708 isoform X1 [Anopheles moucheti]|uniref:uncharacterized protein LOC128309708 isoform X1 n=1 Tax=Anopheles moucheti TaxID=186751 RepID=UPI0022F0F802|nr:uncharacterized protein LOC128309708 isoform X1 [Anopheles moucheti]XP_052902122.1 uncharacterized protein LOC128309708 isoform X1 [Anopheles moucheti]XP_052902123.1 uncharacterized protein LOC128309708 isoform X1 [Anopheles moucheti]XP_052902124.1 uncharacterized protein LOC128309708 isoform X1 [Anopheles moucheti]